MNDDLLKWYLSFDGYDEDEFKKLDTIRDEAGVERAEGFTELTQKFMDRMLYCNINSKNRYIRFDESGTAIIRKIFKKEVDDDTLVITTNYEHTAVQECVQNCNNVYKFDMDKIRNYETNEVIFLAKKYKKVFVYIIGTSLASGEIIPQLFFDQLKQELTKYDIPHKIVIDDVHGMFITPRDYSMFDYVLYTAHALVPGYDMGMLISKTDDIGFTYYDWGDKYLERLDIVLKRRAKIMMFKNVMFQLLNKTFCNKKYFRYYDYTTNHIFAVETKELYFTKEEYDKLHSYRIRITKEPSYYSWIRIRYQELTKQPYEKAIEGLHYLDRLIKTKIMTVEMRE